MDRRCLRLKIVIGLLIAAGNTIKPALTILSTVYTVLVLAALVIYLNLLSDISYCYLDPCIKLETTPAERNAA